LEENSSPRKLKTPLDQCVSFMPGHRTHYGPARNDWNLEKIPVQITHLHTNAFRIQAEGIDEVWYEHFPKALIESLRSNSADSFKLVQGRTRVQLRYQIGPHYTATSFFHFSKEPFEPCVPLDN